MHLRRRSFLAIVAVLVVMLTIVPLVTLQAQDNSVVLTLAFSGFNQDTVTNQLISDFESSHPGIKVVINKNDPSIPQPANGLDAYFTALQTYTTSADVVYIDPRRVPMTSAATSAGYFLDLSPLVNGDQSLNVDDFYPAVWQSYQWDKGIWALPTATDAFVLSYDPAAFDKAGLAYPDDKWTLKDLVDAANKLVQKDASGKVTQAPISIFPPSNDAALFRSLLGQSLFDTSTIPNSPQLDTPATEDLLTNWLQLQQAGLIGSSFNDFQSAPINIGSVTTFFRRPGANDVQHKGVLLPGGKSALSVQGFAVSAGTQHPEQAYALAEFLTTRAELTRGSISPARKSLVGVQAAGGNGGNGGPGGGGRGGGGGAGRNLSADVQALLATALDNGLPTSEVRFAEYLDVALKNMSANNVSAKDALEAVQTQALGDQKTALAKKSTVAFTVATAVPTAVLTAGKIELKFNYGSFVSPLPNQDKWDALIKDFTSTDPQVGRVTFDTTQRFGTIDSTVQANDCFILPNNAVPTMNLGLVLNIDPFLAADSTFDKSDVIGNAMDQLQRDGKTWAYPLFIQPTILKYDSDQFTRANLQQPAANWTIDAFSDDIKALKPNSTDPAPFTAVNSNGVHLLILMADYGGLPLDYRTNPPTINFTDPATVDAIRQVLDLAKQGYIDYQALSSFNFGGGDNSLQSAIYGDVLNAFTARARFGRSNAGNNANSNNTISQDTYKSAAYPKGKSLSGVSYSIGTAYISAKSQNPEACYRFITAISKHPDLFSAMPARRSMIDDPSLAANTDAVTLYHQLDALMKDPNTLTFPSLGGAGGNPSSFLLQHWLYEAFDNYVVNNADLDSALKDAQTYATTFMACAANIPPFDPATQNQRNYNQQYQACATQADPRLGSSFGGGGGSQSSGTQSAP